MRNTFKEVDGRFRFATFMDHKVGDTLLQQFDENIRFSDC